MSDDDKRRELQAEWDRLEREIQDLKGRIYGIKVKLWNLNK